MRHATHGIEQAYAAFYMVGKESLVEVRSQTHGG